MMLSREVMGLACIGVVWVTALLVAGAAWHDLRDLRAVARLAQRFLVRGEIASGDGEGGALAEWCVEQTGRALDATEPAMAFHDRAFRSRIHGGSVRSGAVTYSIAAAEGEVWPREGARAQAAAHEDRASFEEAYALARKAKGFHREVRVRLRAGDGVWIVGRVEGEAIVAPPGGALVVASVDPRRFCARKSRAIVLFVLAELAACAAVTRLAWSSPHFGALSVAGAVLCLGFFLGVTPLAVALRESVRFPSVAYLRGSWRRPAAQGDSTGPAAPARSEVRG